MQVCQFRPVLLHHLLHCPSACVSISIWEAVCQKRGSVNVQWCRSFCTRRRMSTCVRHSRLSACGEESWNRPGGCCLCAIAPLCHPTSRTHQHPFSPAFSLTVRNAQPDSQAGKAWGMRCKTAGINIDVGCRKFNTRCNTTHHQNEWARDQANRRKEEGRTGARGARGRGQLRAESGSRGERGRERDTERGGTAGRRD